MTLSLPALNPISPFMTELSLRIRNAIRDVADFPKPGIVFKDITPILLDAELSNEIVIAIANQYANERIDAVCGIESRGFLFGLPVAMALNVPFIPVRKQGKLPYKTVSHAYDLEYGSAVVEMHNDAVRPGMRVLIHDDLLATGGTACAAASLVKSQSGQIAGFNFLVDLTFLRGQEVLKTFGAPVHCMVSY
jgi:adenine phosphoribosyltransferase